MRATQEMLKSETLKSAGQFRLSSNQKKTSPSGGEWALRAAADGAAVNLDILKSFWPWLVLNAGCFERFTDNWRLSLIRLTRSGI